MDVTRPLRRPVVGVTLLELLTTCCVAVTLTAVAVPAVHQFVVVQSTAAATNALVTDLALARQQAVTAHLPVVLCPSSDGTACTGGYDWSDGWLSFADRDGDRRLDPEERRLKVTANPSSQVRILTSTGRRKIVYRVDGSTAGTNATFRICNAEDPDRRRAVIINGPGRPRLSRRLVGGGYIECD